MSVNITQEVSIQFPATLADVKQFVASCVFL